MAIDELIIRHQPPNILISRKSVASLDLIVRPLSGYLLDQLRKMIEMQLLSAEPFCWTAPDNCTETIIDVLVRGFALNTLPPVGGSAALVAGVDADCNGDRIAATICKMQYYYSNKWSANEWRQMCENSSWEYTQLISRHYLGNMKICTFKRQYLWASLWELHLSLSNNKLNK